MGHTRVRLAAAMAAVTMTAGLLLACAPAAPAVDASAVGELSVEVPGEVKPTVEPATLPDSAVAELNGFGRATDFVMGTPMSIELAGDFPAEGATLARSYAQPLPADVAVTFAYWDEEYDTWFPVPTTISEDRITATATVSHFSLWNDFLSGSQQALTAVRDGAAKAGQVVVEWTGNGVQAVVGAAGEAAKALHWSLGNMFSTRVELPECDNPTPQWVIDAAVSFDVNDPVRFCVGHDKADPDLLVVKARSNRGYGFPATLATEPAWEYNSTNENTLDATIDNIAALDAAVGAVVAELWADGRYVGPGEEISFGVPAHALDGYDSKVLLELGAPNLGQFISSTVTQQLVAWGIGKADASLAAIIAVAGCWNDMRSVNELGKAAGAVTKCLNSIKDDITKTLQSALLANGSTIATAEGAGKLIGRVGMVAALLPAAISAADYIAELNFPREVRSLKVTTSKAPAPPSESAEAWLITAQGVGPIRLGHVVDDLKNVRERRYMCSGDPNVGWVVAGADNGNIGGGETGSWIQVSGLADRPGDAPAPRTESGITIGSTIAELQADGFHSNVDSEFYWRSLGGVTLTAVAFPSSDGEEPRVTSLVLGRESLGVLDCG